MLKNGKAMDKMREIIGLQGGNSKIKIEDLPIGQYKYTVKAEKAGKISHIDNKAINKIAKAAGSQRDKGAGV
jgi:AMP phosphorylase